MLKLFDALRYAFSALADAGEMRENRDLCIALDLTGQPESEPAAFAACSRTQAEKLFSAEKVFVNGRTVTDRSTRLKEGDALSVRGFGKAVYDGIEYETKKNRLWVRLRKLI